jgi:hypothetical protein
MPPKKRQSLAMPKPKKATPPPPRGQSPPLTTRTRSGALLQLTAPPTALSPPAVPVVGKRGRGRPKKIPLPLPHDQQEMGKSLPL